MGSIDFFDAVWIYEAASSSVRVSKCGSKQTTIPLDTRVIPRWVKVPQRKQALNFSSFQQRKAGKKLHNRTITLHFLNGTNCSNWCTNFGFSFWFLLLYNLDSIFRTALNLNFQKGKRSSQIHRMSLSGLHSFIPLSSCHPKVITIIMVSVFPNGICAVIMYASILCRHYQPCHPELHKCNYTKPLITKQCNLLPEWKKNILELYDSKRKTPEYHRWHLAEKIAFFGVWAN